MNITVRYFASLREERGCAEEDLQTEAGTAEGVYRALREKHGFKLESTQVRFAVGTEYVGPDHFLAEGDDLTFIPPVSGG